MKNGFKEGLGEWEGGTNTNGWIGRTGGKIAGMVETLLIL